jgi:hypothetical protein
VGEISTSMIENANPQLEKLPFVKYREGKRSIWWDVAPTGRWVEDFIVGREYAVRFLELEGTTPTFSLDFQQVILAMIEASKRYKGCGFSGIEAGFLLAVGEHFGGMNHVQAFKEAAEKFNDP